MRVLMISTDQKIFETGSAVQQRMLEYGTLVNELHIIVFTPKGKQSQKIGQNVWIYPTNSASKFFYVHSAKRLGASLIRSHLFQPRDTIITTQDPFETGWVGMVLKRRFGLHLQIQVHTDFLSPYFTQATFLNRIRAWLARRVLPQANQIRVVSDRIKQSISAHFRSITSEKIAVLPIYTDAEKFNGPALLDIRKKYPQFSSIVLMVSRLTAEKNIPFALKIFKEILKKFSNVGLVIAGDGAEKIALQKQVQEMGLEKNVVFEPWTNDTNSYYKGSNVFLATSLYEGYGLTLIEAGLGEAAVLASDVGVAGSLLRNKENARICPVGDFNCFVETLEELLASPALQQALGVKARTSILRHLRSKADYLQEYKNLFEKTLHGQAF